MAETVEVPEEIPEKELPEETVAAIERYYNDYRREYDSIATTTASATIAGHNPSKKSYATEVEVTSRTPVTLEIDGEEVSFEDAYKTSSKHTYYHGIHVAGYRLTVAYHDASGGGFHRLKVTKEEDV